MKSMEWELPPEWLQGQLPGHGPLGELQVYAPMAHSSMTSQG